MLSNLGLENSEMSLKEINLNYTYIFFEENTSMRKCVSAYKKTTYVEKNKIVEKTNYRDLIINYLPQENTL